LSSDRGAELVAAACSSCHSDEMLRQQRLTAGQWEKTVKKMLDWGAVLTSEEASIVISHLSTAYATDGGPYEVAVISSDEASKATEPLDDGPFSAGEPERGGSFYAARCASCHGADARGQIGVNLVDRPLLYRPSEFAETIRTGRAKMPAQPGTSDNEVADLLAHLRIVTRSPSRAR
jgi:mono/diheme cytochrome c family protein